MDEKITAATINARYLANNDDMLMAERQYQDFEHELAERVANVERDFVGYHAYHYDIDPIGHNPYVLISILSAIKPDFSINDQVIKETFNILQRPRHQYTLTITMEVAPELQAEYEDIAVDSIDRKFVDVYVKLTNFELHCTVDNILSRQQLCAYAGYIRSYGCRPDLFPINEYPNATPKQPNIDYEVPSTTITTYPLLAKMLPIANKLIGYPYVWSGSDIDTSFDCSGFVDYVLDQIGYRYRNNINGREVRLPVAGSSIGDTFYDGLYEKCMPIESNNRQPGDLVFFTGTFDASYRAKNLSHVGIYVGEDMFIACGSSRGVCYQCLDDKCSSNATWRDLLACYGRLTDSLND